MSFLKEESYDSVKPDHNSDAFIKNISEISNLINIRNYIMTVVESSTIDNSQSHEVMRLSKSLDQLIVSKLLSNDFKKMINHPETKIVPDINIEVTE